MQGLVSLREFGPDDRVGVGFEIREKGDIFGCGSLTPACKYTLTAVCMEETKVLAVDADQLFKLCDIDTGLGYKLMKKVARIYFERFETAKKQIHEMVKIPHGNNGPARLNPTGRPDWIDRRLNHRLFA